MISSLSLSPHLFWAGCLLGSVCLVCLILDTCKQDSLLSDSLFWIYPSGYTDRTIRLQLDPRADPDRDTGATRSRTDSIRARP